MRSLAMTLSIACAALSSGSAAAQALERLVWERRVLLVFAPSTSDSRARRIETALAARECEVRDRDLTVVRVPADGAGSVDGEPLPSRDAESVRAAHGVPSAAFAVVLIGTDCGEKMRAAEPPDLGAVSALIDGMPMRRAEMREPGPRCPD